MKVVIDIPEDEFIMIKQVVGMGIGSSVDKIICSGTPFPKGHATVDRVLEIIDKHIKFTQDCNDDISPLMGLRRDIEQMKNEDMV